MEDVGVHALAVGFGLGFFVALQLGPMSLFLIRSTLRRGWIVGLAIGAGIATVDGLYAMLGACGAAPVVLFEPVRLAFGVIGAAVLLAMGARTLWTAFRVRHGAEFESDVGGAGAAFLTSIGATASNPATIVSWAAIFAAATAAGAADSASGVMLLVLGVVAGSALWVTALATGVAAVRRTVGERVIRIADTVAGVGLMAFGGVLASSSARDLGPAA
jgi:putative LysE/RhtB family amino acid efflux pump